MPDAVSQAHSSRHLIRRCLPDAAALGVWTAAIVLFFWPVLSGRRVFFYFDVTELNYPYRAFFGNALREGRFPPLWCPHLYCGFPLFAESQTGYLYPLKYLLYPWMPPWLAFGYDTVLSIWLAGVAMYAYLRRRVRPAAALAGAVPFGYGGFMAAHLIHTSYVNSMMWIPLALLAMERAWESGRVKYVVYAAVCLAMQILAGNMQIAILTYLALAVMAAYWIMVAVAGRRNAGEASSTKADGRRAALAVSATTAAACVLATALGAVQILPAKRLLDQSPRRGGLNFDELTGQSSWHPELLPTLFLPNAFGSRSHNTDWLDGYYWYHEMYVYLGVTTLLLALIGGTGWRNRWVFGHIVLTAVCVLLMLGKYTFLYNFFPYVPILRGMRAPVRESVWLGLSVGALAAMGVERLCRGEGIRLRAPLWTFAGLAGAALLLVVGAYSPYLMGDLRATRAADLPTSFPWEPNAFREQRLIRQITTDAAAATLLALATLLMVWRLARGQRAGQAASMQANSPSPAISSRRADSPNPPPNPPPQRGRELFLAGC
ncbi:MAG: hypothetical protein HY000_23335 [Planctomycetes bacterium]|nr:hypothetical protein [Planctomycetota bacterium]